MNENLQDRYPVMRDGEEVYVLREHLTLEERREISAKLRAEAEADFYHAEVLRTEMEVRQELGEIE